MAEAWQRQSPLARRSPMDDDTGAGLAMSEREFLAKITVRGKVADDAIRDALGLSLPGEPNTACSGEDHAILWLGPDEWLVVGPPDTERELVSTLGAALPDAAVIDVTEGYATIRLGGPLARDVLSMGTPLDLHPREFAAGAATRTLFARTTIILHKISDDPVFDIHVERSQAEYLWTWLETASRPYRDALR
ncbi:MAG: sarcosine oxidase subunit gamma [Alphaproteobacteria bacterium]|nr:sarcosine oxidase subunit gamma [Alphaproteobacteria bacterium]